MITYEQDCLFSNTLRKPGEPCICKREKHWMHGWDWKNEWDSHIKYIKLGDDPFDDMEIDANDSSHFLNTYHLFPNFLQEIFTLDRDQFHPKLNPETGKCSCCDCTVYKLLQHNCCDCGILLCSDCIVQDRYDYMPQERGFVCILCRVHDTRKNTDNHY